MAGESCFTVFFAVVIFTINCSASDRACHGAYLAAYEGSAKDRAAIAKTGDAIRAAFARGDVDGIMAYHHPDVIKALTPGSDYQIGSEAVKTGLMQTFQAFTLQFDQSHVDNLFFQGDTAVEESTFAIRGTPKGNAQPFVFKGRSMVVYVVTRRAHPAGPLFARSSSRHPDPLTPCADYASAFRRITSL